MTETNPRKDNITFSAPTHMEAGSHRGADPSAPQDQAVQEQGLLSSAGWKSLQAWCGPPGEMLTDMEEALEAVQALEMSEGELRAVIERHQNRLTTWRLASQSAVEWLTDANVPGGGNDRNKLAKRRCLLLLGIAQAARWIQAAADPLTMLWILSGDGPDLGEVDGLSGDRLLVQQLHALHGNGWQGMRPPKIVKEEPRAHGKLVEASSESSAWRRGPRMMTSDQRWAETQFADGKRLDPPPQAVTPGLELSLHLAMDLLRLSPGRYHGTSLRRHVTENLTALCNHCVGSYRSNFHLRQASLGWNLKGSDGKMMNPWVEACSVPNGSRMHLSSKRSGREIAAFAHIYVARALLHLLPPEEGTPRASGANDMGAQIIDQIWKMNPDALRKIQDHLSLEPEGEAEPFDLSRIGSPGHAGAGKLGEELLIEGSFYDMADVDQRSGLIADLLGLETGIWLSPALRDSLLNQQSLALPGAWTGPQLGGEGSGERLQEAGKHTRVNMREEQLLAVISQAVRTAQLCVLSPKRQMSVQAGKAIPKALLGVLDNTAHPLTLRLGARKHPIDTPEQRSSFVAWLSESHAKRSYMLAIMGRTEKIVPLVAMLAEVDRHGGPAGDNVTYVNKVLRERLFLESHETNWTEQTLRELGHPGKPGFGEAALRRIAEDHRELQQQLQDWEDHPSEQGSKENEMITNQVRTLGTSMSAAENWFPRGNTQRWFTVPVARHSAAKVLKFARETADTEPGKAGDDRVRAAFDEAQAAVTRTLLMLGRTGLQTAICAELQAAMAAEMLSPHLSPDQQDPQHTQQQRQFASLIAYLRAVADKPLPKSRASTGSGA